MPTPSLTFVEVFEASLSSAAAVASFKAVSTAFFAASFLDEAVVAFSSVGALSCFSSSSLKVTTTVLARRVLVEERRACTL